MLPVRNARSILRPLCRSRAGLSTACGQGLFDYTSGRWLYDEDLQLKRRYIEFNVNALQRVAGRILGHSCSQISKLPEGFYNKVFLLKTELGGETLARIPNPNAGSASYVIASEVATLDFLRNVLDIPVPEVIDWSPPSTQPDAVGAGYMLMKKVKGCQLSEVWPDMSEAQRFRLVKSVVAIEAKLSCLGIQGYGSIYYRDSSPNGMPLEISAFDQGSETDVLDKFVLGPSTDRDFWVDGRESLELDRGPWSTAAEYISAIAKREVLCIRNSVPNQSRFHASSLAKGDRAREAHIKLLHQFLTLLPYILPPVNITQAVLLHHDLHADNIFIDIDDPTKITGIIDWQATYAAPLFLQTRFPSIFDCEDPYPWGAVQPELPKGFDSMTELDKQAAEQQFSRLRLKKFYELASRKFNPDIPRAMDAMSNDDDPTSFIFHLLGQTSVDGPIPFQELLIQVCEKWDILCAKRGSGIPCPVSFSSDDISRHREKAACWAAIYGELNDLLVTVGGKDGWVSHDEYPAALLRFNQHREALKKLRGQLEETLEDACYL
ncbi:hypothetical protein LOZ39_006439 [Ophidiomyces ophidiicola]|uniref:Uncharacterized protein n=1 Tax=Ophidiomyces ophidiicola TaxID=1387563 RepID=A0ACB8UN69_9EURO|nr:hypothetical protein LOZ64_006476 [Ophidiomyces ophidiicola]KAI1909314.1 hypothetical protein LOZ61_005050 [Ophidiomyces ophidiicola]KAI1920494.1 hypothetical protein LOZ60_006564 [Ophidiomyces ophidiicola]KAI2004013.1 hypothetical protein LOZ49_006031 [Ophidiomyces ophidiicola]KAI2016720.1 hypothetical protein LOZ46_004855 [Ophidiomyces ophidiicola]